MASLRLAVTWSSCSTKVSNISAGVGYGLALDGFASATEAYAGLVDTLSVLARGLDGCGRSRP